MAARTWFKVRRGPNREKLFDCLRLREERRVVEFRWVFPQDFQQQLGRPREVDQVSICGILYSPIDVHSWIIFGELVGWETLNQKISKCVICYNSKTHKGQMTITNETWLEVVAENAIGFEPLPGAPFMAVVSGSVELAGTDVASAQSEPYPPIAPGTPVITTEQKVPDSEWTEKAQVNRKWGVKGTVLRRHDSHGLCYDVRHGDGTVGCYDPSELEIVQ